MNKRKGTSSSFDSMEKEKDEAILYLENLYALYSFDFDRIQNNMTQFLKVIGKGVEQRKENMDNKRLGNYENKRAKIR
jgi:hypothetical protein